MSDGEERILESVEAILQTARGTCPMDPGYGLDIDAYDPIKSPDSAAWRVAQAIRRSEPRIDELEVAIVSVEPNNGTLWLEIRVTPIGSSTPLIRTYPLYRVD
jgi:phage baseplate assembly protein W